MDISPHTTRSDATLLQDFLQGIQAPEPATLAAEAISKFKSIAGVYAAPPTALHNCGFPESTIRLIHDAREIATRGLYRELEKDKTVFSASTQILDYCKAKYGDGHVERAFVLHLNNAHELIFEEVLSYGDYDSVPFPIRKCVTHALHYNAASIIVGHNHPSADTATPSNADIALSRQLKQALEPVKIGLLDSLVVTRTDAFSMAIKGLLQGR